ncbi:6-phosphogluconolactonase [Bacteroides sp. 51]|uniref:6-phosphogluconolactonase n=1 Tax=Bacteroides sp. 51 TaxID=2302938 RepID=UPI0013D1BA4A|nr:6-phosphogluconolactonase [Bacteroides sp. 51]NDV81970.1 6-phosphogluconolactonase [Bacteroides sp. 51]
MKLNIYPSPTAVAYALISHILQLMKEQPDKTFNIAFSGGSTPAIMFDLWAHDIVKITPWERMNIWWVDERCVQPGNPESNYGLMRKLLLSDAPIPSKNIFRIRGEEKPQAEAVRYSSEVEKHVPKVGQFPSFDIVLLGVGNDGHTSSIFPGQEHLLSSCKTYEVSENPKTKQARIALTGNPILNSQHVIFLVTGKEKASVINEIYTSGDVTPSAYIAHHANYVEFFLDKAAASELSK